MKVMFTGGGTGGHFFPIIATAQAINTYALENKLDVKLYYAAPEPYNKEALFENNIKFIHCSAGKIRRYFSLKNFFDLFKTFWGIIQAFWIVFKIYPDVIFGKGGYASFPVLCAAWFFRIPVVIHESDSIPGKVNKWAGGFAKRIAISHPDAATYFVKNKTALTGNPIRKEILGGTLEGARQYLKLEQNIPVILFLGGSQGAKIINENLITALPDLVQKYQIIHQTGKDNFDAVKEAADQVLEASAFKNRYMPFAMLNNEALRMAGGAADLVVSRAGSTIFEIALWNVPSIIIPIPESVSHDQRENAYSYARTGAAVVIDENNLTPHVLISEIDEIMANQAEREKMKAAAKNFAKADAAELIAKEILSIALEHKSYSS